MKKTTSHISHLTFHKAQAMLVAILMITAAALAIGLGIAGVASSQINLSVSSRDSNLAYSLAEGCLENTLMRMARGDVSLPPDLENASGKCIIKISGNAPYEIIAEGLVGRSKRKIRATVNINNEVLSIVSLKEEY